MGSRSVNARSHFDFVGSVENRPLNAAVVAGVVGAGVHDLLSAGGENPTNFRRLVASDCSSDVWRDWHYLAGFERLVQRQRVLEIEGVELGQLVIGDGFDKVVEAEQLGRIWMIWGFGCKGVPFTPTMAKKLTQVRHWDEVRRQIWE